ncbi:MAG TPA: hypothetical protein DCS30_06660 [Rhizobiales bacterium]|nr:hypothetical protein [Hyphomicrobiales bacterium]
MPELAFIAVNHYTPALRFIVKYSIESTRKKNIVSHKSDVRKAGFGGLLIGSLLLGLTSSVLAQGSFLDEFDNPSPIEGVIPWKTTDVHIHPNLKGKTYISREGFVVTSSDVFKAYKHKNNNFKTYPGNRLLEREDHSPIYFRDRNGKTYIALIDLPTLIFQIEPLNLPALQKLLDTQTKKTPFEQRHAALKAISPGFGLAFQRGDWGKWSAKTSMGVWDFPRAVEGRLHLLNYMVNENDQYRKKDHPNTAAYLRKKASKLEKQGKFEEARQLRQRALNIQERLFGIEDIIIVTGLSDLGANLYKQRKYEEAIPLFQRALSIQDQKPGTDSRDTTDILGYLTKTLHAQRKFKEATPFYQRILKIHERKFSKDSIITANSLNYLAINLYMQKKYAEAAPLYQRALKIHETRYGADNPKTADSLNYLAVNLYAQRRYDRAAPLFQRALDIRQHKLGKDNPKTAAARTNLINSHNALAFGFRSKNEHAKAEPHFRKVVQLRRKQPDAEIFKATAYHNLADNLFWQGKIAQAKSQSDQALSIARTLQEDHQNIGIFLRVRARIQQAQGDHQNARKSAEEAITILTRTLGKDHAKTLDAISILANIKKNSP